DLSPARVGLPAPAQSTQFEPGEADERSRLRPPSPWRPRRATPAHASSAEWAPEGQALSAPHPRLWPSEAARAHGGSRDGDEDVRHVGAVHEHDQPAAAEASPD